ncbi:MAG: hypothetical protein ACLR1T_14900 [Evtepia gabavorous]
MLETEDYISYPKENGYRSYHPHFGPPGGAGAGDDGGGAAADHRH